MTGSPIKREGSSFAVESIEFCRIIDLLGTLQIDPRDFFMVSVTSEGVSNKENLRAKKK